MGGGGLASIILGLFAVCCDTIVDAMWPKHLYAAIHCGMDCCKDMAHIQRIAKLCKLKASRDEHVASQASLGKRMQHTDKLTLKSSSFRGT
jgi:hypothetical protein